MIWDSFLRFLVDMAWFAGGWIALALAFRLIRLAWRRVARSRLGWWARERRAVRIQRAGRRVDRATGRILPVPSPPPVPTPAPPVPEWSGALIVRADGDRLLPSIQLRGGPFRAPARVRLDLLDEDGTWRRMGEREVWDPDLGTEVRLPEVLVPDGLDVEDVVGWVWKAVLEVGGRDQVLCWEVLRPVAGVNREAELAARDDAAV